MINLLIAIGTIFALLAAWIYIQHAARIFAAKHPECSPAKDAALGCGKACGCEPDNCGREK